VPWTIPDKGEGASDVQSIVFQEYLEVLVAGLEGRTCVVHGCTVAAQGVPNMTVAVARGSVLSNGTLFPVAAASVTIPAADATNGRLDLVVVTSAGALAARAGTAAANPKPPARTAGDVVLAVVWVPAAASAVAAAQLVDLRVVRSLGPLVLASRSTPVTFNNTAAIQTYASLTVPAGLLAAGRKLRVRAGGTYLSNSGTPTWTLTVSYGGTTLFADATAATTADADRGAWDLDVVLSAESLTVQDLVGTVRMQTPGAKTAPAAGVGDLSVTSNVVAPIRGTAAVDSAAANRDLLIRWTMSVANAAVETVCEHAVFELI
jgi:hypothetical protein